MMEDSDSIATGGPIVMSNAALGPLPPRGLALEEDPRARRLRIAGTGPLEEHVRSMALIEDDVDYLGHLDRCEVPAAIQQCGVVVIPSLSYEGLPLVFVEALAYGRPVMVNHGTSAASMVSDELAWSVHPTVASWRMAVEMLRQEDVEARGMAARKRYSETCSPPAALKSLLQIYDELLGGSA